MSTQISKRKFARQLRLNPTPAEYLFWSHVRCLQIAGYKFRRQYPLGIYIIDFICIEKMLIVEIDGGQHNDVKHTHYDAFRTRWLEKRGYRVLRFWNNEILGNMEGVIEVLYKELSEPPPPTLPL